MASFPLANIFSDSRISILFPNTYGYIRTDLSTNGAAGALSVVIPAHIEISLPIDFLSNLDQFFRTGDGTESTSLTSLLINLNFSHHQPPTGTVE
jgi:hypothetical protein